MLKQTLTDKSFLPLWLSHFLSVINDGFVRTVFLFLVTYQMTQTGTSFVLTAVILYAMCYCLGSLYAGQLADKISRVRFLRWIRMAEIGLMTLALLFVAVDSRILLTLLLAAFGVTGSCLRVVNNALLPKTVGDKALNTANLWMKGLSVLGAGFSALLLTFVLKFNAVPVVCAVTIVSALASFALILLMPKDEPADPNSRLMSNPITAFNPVLQSLKHQFDRWAYIVGIAWFWVLGALVLFFSARYGHDVLNARWSVVSFLSGGLFTVGYLIGGIIYYRLTRHGKLFSWVVVSGLGITLFLTDLILAGGAIMAQSAGKAITVHDMFGGGWNYWRVITDTLMLGGLSVNFVLPFYTMLHKFNEGDVITIEPWRSAVLSMPLL